MTAMHLKLDRLALRLIRHDNLILGLVLALIALDRWRHLWARALQFAPYIDLGLFTVPMLSLLAIAFSAVYLTIVSAIMLLAKQPAARYETLLPNLMAVAAGFGVYAFAWLAPAEQPLVHITLPLALLVAGAVLVLVALAYLRRAFSVTPQARCLVNAGPYALVRHPMYLGNMLSLAGLGLLLGTPETLLLALGLCVLQIVRACFEERLLSKTFPAHRANIAQVGAFWPRRRAAGTSRILGLCIAVA